MNLRQLRSLVTILDSGSFAAAGDRIGLSHAAISVQMQQLESSLGVDLFDRSNRPVRLTTTGVRIAHLATDVLAKIENIRQEASGAETTGSVSIGFIPTSVSRGAAKAGNKAFGLGLSTARNGKARKLSSGTSRPRCQDSVSWL